MKTTLVNARRLRQAAAFTLVELLTVIAIIVLLVGITIGILGFAQEKSAVAKAEVQLAFITNGLELYKKVYKEFPEPVDNDGKGWGGSEALYQALSGDGDDKLFLGGTEGSTASTGKPGSSDDQFQVAGIDPSANKHGLVGAGYRLVDPFGQPWYYRLHVEDDPGDPTRNKTFDLWSVGTDRRQENEAKWIKNW